MEPPPREEGLETEAAAIDAETDDPTLPQRLRTAPPEGRTETREPLYVEEDVDRAMAQARGCDYGDEVAVTDGVTAVFHDAGHILGSAIIELRLTDGDARRTLVFSGDLGRTDTPIVRDPTPLTHADPRRHRVDLRQPRARPARGRHRGAGGRNRRGRSVTRACC